MEISARTFRRFWTDVGGLWLHAVASTTRPARVAPPVVLVHGLGLSGRYMMPTAERLAPSVPVYAPDLPGFGDSNRPDRILDVPGLADGLAAWIRVNGLAPVALLGNSFGCQVIVDLAARFPDLVACAILQGPTTPPGERTWVWQFLRWRQNQRFNPASLNPIAQSDYRKCTYRRLLLTFHHSLIDRPEDKLPRIQAPALVVRGQRDPICRPDWAAQVAACAPLGRWVELPGVAHTLVYTAPDPLAAVSLQFLAEICP